MSAYAAKGKGLIRTDRAGARAVVQRADYEPCTDVINIVNLCSACSLSKRSAFSWNLKTDADYW